MNNINSDKSTITTGQLIGTIKKLKGTIKKLKAQLSTHRDYNQRFSGKIIRKFYTTNKGIIIEDDSNEQFHFHFSDCVNQYELNEEVTFEIFKTI